MSEYEIPRAAVLTHLTSLYNSAVLIDATHAIVAHQGTDVDGFIQTFSWDSDFVNLAVVDTLEHELTDITYSSLIKIDATHYALVYADVNGDGFIATFSINGSYVITEVDSFEFDIGDGIWTSMALMDSTHAVLAYSGVDGDGFIKTFSWDSGTADNIALVDTLEHETTGPATNNSIVLIDPTHFALAYTGVDGDGFLKTFSMTSVGGSIAEIAVLEHDIAGAENSSLILIDTDGGVTHLALAYTSPVFNGTMKTFSTDSSYATLTQIDILLFGSSTGQATSLVMIDTDTEGSHFIVAHGTGGLGEVTTLSIDGNYDNITLIANWRHVSGANGHNSLIKIDDSHYFLAYTGAGNLGTVKTIPVFGEEPVACPDAPAGGSLAGSGGWIF